MRFLTLAFISLILATGLPHTAKSAEILACGDAVDGDRHANAESNVDFCNIYERRISYYKENVKFRENLEARRKSYHAPRSEAYKDYQSNLDALNKSR